MGRFFDALDLLSIATRTFWQPVNENTFIVMEDNQQNRRDFERHSAETIYLPSAVSVSRLNEILNHLRTLLSLRGIFQNESANAIFIHDTPGRMVLAETMIATLTGTPVRKKPVTDLRTAFAENAGGSFYTSASDRASLQIKTSTPISFNVRIGNSLLTCSSRSSRVILLASAINLSVRPLKSVPRSSGCTRESALVAKGGKRGRSSIAGMVSLRTVLKITAGLAVVTSGWGDYSSPRHRTRTK